MFSNIHQILKRLFYISFQLSYPLGGFEREREIERCRTEHIMHIVSSGLDVSALKWEEQSIIKYLTKIYIAKQALHLPSMGCLSAIFGDFFFFLLNFTLVSEVNGFCN